MRIRRYAARLLASSTSTAPSSPPPQPAASWFHAADDDCAFCELSRSAPQVAPDAIKHKGHIAGRVREPELKSDERIGLAQRTPVPEAQGCKIDDEPPVIKAASGLEVTRGASCVSGAAARPEGTGGVSLVSEAATEPAFTGGPFIANEGTSEQEVRGTSSLVDESAAEPEVTGGASLVNGLITEPEVLREASPGNEAFTEPEVSERVSLVNEAATERAVIVTVPELTGGVEGAAEPQVTRGASLVNESAAEMEVIRGASVVSEAATEPGFTEGVSLVSEAVIEPGVTGAASLDNESAVEPEVAGGASLVNEAAELEITGGAYIANEAAAKPEVTGGASACCGDGDAALDEPRPPDCNVEIIDVQIGNAGEAFASTMQPCRGDAADVVGSVNSTSIGPVRTKSPTSEEVAPHDGCSDTPSVSCVSDIVARSVGKSGRTDIICYARRRGKRKLEIVDIKTEQFEMDDGAIYDQCDEKVTLERTGPCESAMSTAGSTEIKIADIKRELVENSAASKGKKMKIQRFECDIDYCRMTFKTRAELSVHKKNMCTVKSCSRHFRSHKYLRRHQSIHNDEMPYKCPWESCSMAFKSTWALAEHFQVHTGEKPYKCMTPGCGKIYKFVSDFTRHWRRCKPQEALSNAELLTRIKNGFGKFIGGRPPVAGNRPVTGLFPVYSAAADEMG